MQRDVITSVSSASGTTPPPRFALRTLMLGVGALCVLLALMKALGPTASMALLLAMFAVLAHVAGNALGTRLRDLGGHTSRHDKTDINRLAARSHAPIHVGAGPSCRLRHRAALGWAMVVVTVMGAIAGAVAGGVALTWLNWEQATLGNIALGTSACSLLGGFSGFLAGSFCEVALGALRETR